MPAQALFVDLPNFYSGLLRSGIADERTLRDYFLYWFDFDRLAEKLTGSFCPVWVFYSGRRFGPSANRIQERYLDELIARFNSLRGVTAWDVNIPGQQREPASYACENCGHSGMAQWESEKGIDASLTVHLFDTMETWETAFLLSGDADFVPAVQSLRRRGKIVIGAGFATPSSALVRECYDYIDLLSDFIHDDFVAFEVFRENGLLDAWMRQPVQASGTEGALGQPIELIFHWQSTHGNELDRSIRRLRLAEAVEIGGPRYIVNLMYNGPLDLETREAAIDGFRNRYRPHVRERAKTGSFVIYLSPLAWFGVTRRLESVYGRYEAAGGTVSPSGVSVVYVVSDESHGYVLKSNSNSNA